MKKTIVIIASLSLILCCTSLVMAENYVSKAAPPVDLITKLLTDGNNKGNKVVGMRKDGNTYEYYWINQNYSDETKVIRAIKLDNDIWIVGEKILQK